MGLRGPERPATVAAGTVAAALALALLGPAAGRAGAAPPSALPPATAAPHVTQDRVDSVRLKGMHAEVDVDGEGRATVRVVGMLAGDVPAPGPAARVLIPRGTELWPAEGGDATRAGGGEGRAEAAHVRLLGGVVATGPGGGTQVEFRYRVEGARAGGGVVREVVVPLPALEAALEESRPSFFEAVVRLPPGWRVQDAFPTGLAAARAEEDAGPDGVVLRTGLPVPPSFLRLELRTDGRRVPGLPLLLDVLAVLALAAFSWAGVRHLRGTP